MAAGHQKQFGTSKLSQIFKNSKPLQLRPLVWPWMAHYALIFKINDQYDQLSNKNG